MTPVAYDQVKTALSELQAEAEESTNHNVRLRGARRLGTLRKTRRRRQRERHETKGLMSKTIAAHVRYKYLYISLPSSAKQQREMTKFCVVWRT